MSPSSVHVVGEVIGERLATSGNGHGEVVVRVLSASKPEAPAHHSFILVDRSTGRTARARYLSWIGYPDLDEASDYEFGRWRHIEPPEETAFDVDWQPFGWGPMAVVWTRPLIPLPV